MQLPVVLLMVGMCTLMRGFAHQLASRKALAPGRSEQHHDPQVIAPTGSTPKKQQLNLASDPRYAEKLKEMEALLLAECAASMTRGDCGISRPTA